MNEDFRDNVELYSWQKKIIDERLKDYFENPDDVGDFEATLDEIKKSL